MKIINLQNDFYIYQFGEDEKKLGINIFMLKSKNECLLIDTGYIEHFNKVKADLDNKGITIKKLITTHYHPDHIGGVLELPDVDSIGSIFASDTLHLFYENVNDYLPKTIINKTTVLKFGNHILKIELNPGHSKDGLLITVNNKYLLVGDDLIFSNKDKQAIPYLAYPGIDHHINSVKKIKGSALDLIIIPNHGNPIDDNIEKNHAIDNTLKYLEYLKENPKCSFDDFNKATNITFMNPKWHSLNVGRIFE